VKHGVAVQRATVASTALAIHDDSPTSRSDHADDDTNAIASHALGKQPADLIVAGNRPWYVSWSGLDLLLRKAGSAAY
jgi:hypothetical protein